MRWVNAHKAFTLNAFFLNVRLSLRIGIRNLGGFMRDFLNIKKILIPTIIPVVFRLGLYFCIIAGIYQIVVNFPFFGRTYWLELPILLFLWFILFPVILRIVCEVLIILARMDASLTDITEQLSTQQEDEIT